MLSKLDEFKLLLKMDADYMPAEYETDLFHYTSPTGFSSIMSGDLEQVTLWASRYDCLNDASEGTVVEEVYQEVCKELRDRDEITEYLYQLFIKVKTARTILLSYNKDEKIKITRPECDRYLCSFSKNKDSLAMWNYYSKGNKYEGFNIGFYPYRIKESLKKLLGDKEAEFHIYPVIYSRSEQKRLIEKMLLKLRDNYDKEQESSIRYIISNRLSEWRLVFKYEFFQHEEEVRIIVDVAKGEKKLPVKHRMNAGYIVPYIELKLEKCDVSYVNFGPLQCDEEQKKHQVSVMEEMLESKGYSALVDYSHIPVRY